MLKTKLEGWWMGAPEVYLEWEPMGGHSDCPAGAHCRDDADCIFVNFVYFDCGNRNCGMNHRNVDKLWCYYTYTCPGPYPYQSKKGFLAFKWPLGCYNFSGYWGPVHVAFIEADWGWCWNSGDDCFIDFWIYRNYQAFGQRWENSKIKIYVHYYNTVTSSSVNPPCPYACP